MPARRARPSRDAPAEPDASRRASPDERPSRRSPRQEPSRRKPKATDSEKKPDRRRNRAMLRRSAGRFAVGAGRRPNQPADEPAAGSSHRPASTRPPAATGRAKPAADDKPATEDKPAARTTSQPNDRPAGRDRLRPTKAEAPRRPQPEPASQPATLVKVQLHFGEEINRPTLMKMIEEDLHNVGLPDGPLRSDQSAVQAGQHARLQGLGAVDSADGRAETEKLLTHTKGRLAETPVFPLANQIGGKVAGDTKTAGDRMPCWPAW